VLTVTQVGTGGDANLVTHDTYTPNPTAQGQTPGGLVATTIDPRGIETDFSYTSFGQVSQIVYAVGTPDQATVSMTYDGNENPASYTNELGQTTLFVFDNSDRKVGQQDPPPDPSQPNVRPTWAWVYDTRGNQLSELDPMNRLTRRVYGPGSDGDEPDLDQIIEPDPAGGSNYTVTTLGHDNAENITSVTDPMQRLQSAGFDADNRQTSITLPNPVGGGSDGPTESVVYDALGFAVQQFDFAGNETDNTFNWRGQVLTTVGPAVPDGHGGQVRPTETETYNGDGQILTDQNPLLATTQDIYDSFGRLKEEILPDPDGSGPLAAPTLHWGHDGDGNVTSFEDANGNFYYFIYNSRNEMTEEDDPSPDAGHTPGPVWHWVYDATGALTETIDPMNRVTQLVRDGDSNVIQTIAPNPTTGLAGDASTTTYDTFDLDNEKLSETTPNGATTSWQRDDLGRTTITTQPVPEVGEAAPVWQDFYNADSELTQEIDPLGRSQTTTLDGMGRPIGQTAFTGVQTAWTYNNLSEILTTTLGTGTLAETSTNTWDALGRKTAVQDANGTTQMAFDLAGRMTSLADSDSNQTVWVRDNLGRVTSEQNPSGTATFSYDTNSNLTKEVDRLGQERDFVFDNLNRETAEKWMSGSTVVNTIATAYNADGEVTSTGDNYSNYAFAYNGQGKVTSVDNAGTPGAPHVALASQYDTQGDRTSLAATLNGTPDFIISYTLDALSRLREIDQQGQSGGNAVAEKSIYLKLNGIGEITEIDRSNMVNAGPQQTTPGWTLVSYDTTTGLLDEVNNIAAGTSIDDLTYTHDTLGRISTFGSIDGTATYGYDHTSQIVSAAYTTAVGGHQPANVSFTWDANGNNAATGNVVSANNEVTNDGTFTYAFDADGNRTIRTRISSDYAADYKTTYAWDYRNRLTDVEFFDNNNVLTKHVHYVYSVYDDLIEEDIDSTGSGSYDTIENFVLDVSPKLPVQVLSLSGTIDASAPDDTVLETTNGALAYRLLNAASLSGADVVAVEEAVNTLTAAGTDRWMLTNNQGTPTDIEDVNGVLIDHMVDSLNGLPVYESNPAVHHLQGFTGGIADAITGLEKDGRRWHDPLSAVWISFDPAGFRAGDANLSRYVGNSPVGTIDPSGLGWLWGKDNWWDWWKGNPPLENPPPPAPPAPPPLTSIKSLIVDEDPTFLDRGAMAKGQITCLATTSITFTAGGGIMKPIVLPRPAVVVGGVCTGVAVGSAWTWAHKPDIKLIDWISGKVGLSEGQRELLHEEIRKIGGCLTKQELLELAKEVKQDYPNK
jgi:RHS repeat-associated protein